MVTRRSVLHAIVALPAAAVAASLAGCTGSGGHDASEAPGRAVDGSTSAVSPSGVRIEYHPAVTAKVRDEVPDLVDTALDRVRSVWAAPLAATGRSLTTPRTVQVTASLEQFVALGGGTASGVAATTRPDGTVVLAPDVWTGTTRQGRIVVIAHELTHVALHSQSSTSARWLVEGPPEWTAYHGTSLALPVIAPAMATAVRAGRVAAGPPSDAEFTNGPLPAAYQSAFTWCSFLAQRATSQTFTAFVLAATDEPADQLGSIFEAHYGATVAQLAGAYEQFQRTTFGTAGPSA